ncbi:MAG: hypothetical protein SAK29_22765 [Scytonema sp. PMC 1069.18]|nr:hypothetical protein [Scytonema sp. PMC 1069.18]
MWLLKSQDFLTKERYLNKSLSGDRTLKTFVEKSLRQTSTLGYK